MRKEELKELIELGHEIEFKYKVKKYSIMYTENDTPNFISFCEYYKKPIDVSNVEELCKIRIDGVTLLNALTEAEKEFMLIL